MLNIKKGIFIAEEVVLAFNKRFTFWFYSKRRAFEFRDYYIILQIAFVSN